MLYRVGLDLFQVFGDRTRLKLMIYIAVETQLTRDIFNRLP